MIYGSWDMKHNKQSFLLFWTIFCPFTLLTTQKIKILKKWKITPSDIIILHLVHHKWQLHDIWFLRYGAQQSFSSFWTIFCPFTPRPPYQPRKSKCSKHEKNNWRYHHFTQVLNDNHMIYGPWDMQQTFSSSHFCH